MSPSGTFAVVTGGGTAGHVLPALAVAEALVANGHAPSTIHYVGAHAVASRPDCSPRPRSLTRSRRRGLQRRLTRRNLGFLPKLVRSARAATRLLRDLRPRVVVSVGGYASVPAVLAARRLRIPDRRRQLRPVPGRASRFAARRRGGVCRGVRRLAAAAGDCHRSARYAGPCSTSIVAATRRPRGPSLGLPPDRFVVAVTGGSQGSGVLNEAVTAMLDSCAADQGLAIRHVVGERFASDASPPRDGRGGVLYQPIAYEPEMPLVYAAADLFVGTRRGEHGARGRGHRRPGDPRAVGGRRRGPSDRERVVARRRWRRRLAPGAADRRVAGGRRTPPLRHGRPRGAGRSGPGDGGGPPQRCAWRISSKPWL